MLRVTSYAGPGVRTDVKVHSGSIESRRSGRIRPLLHPVPNSEESVTAFLLLAVRSQRRDNEVRHSYVTARAFRLRSLRDDPTIE